MDRTKANSAYGGGHLKNRSHQNLLFVKTDVFDVNTKDTKGTKRSSGLKTDFVDQTKTGRGRAETEHAGVKK